MCQKADIPGVGTRQVSVVGSRCPELSEARPRLGHCSLSGKGIWQKGRSVYTGVCGAWHGRAVLFLVRNGRAPSHACVLFRPDILLLPQLHGPHPQPVHLCVGCLLPGLGSPGPWTLAPRDPVEDQVSAYFSHCCVVCLGLGKCLMDEWVDE